MLPDGGGAVSKGPLGAASEAIESEAMETEGDGIESEIFHLLLGEKEPYQIQSNQLSPSSVTSMPGEEVWDVPILPIQTGDVVHTDTTGSHGGPTTMPLGESFLSPAVVSTALQVEEPTSFGSLPPCYDSGAMSPYAQLEERKLGTAVGEASDRSSDKEVSSVSSACIWS